MQILPINPPEAVESESVQKELGKPTTMPIAGQLLTEKELQHSAGIQLSWEYADTRPNRTTPEFN
jgi:hypothetical protein